MKTAIVYYSHHHGNTKKLLDAIALQNEVTLIDATSTNKVDLSEYDRIGFASGIYYTNFAKQVISYKLRRKTHRLACEMKAAFLCKITFMLLDIYIDLIYNLCINQ